MSRSGSELGQGLLWLVRLNCPVWGLYSVPHRLLAEVLGYLRTQDIRNKVAPPAQPRSSCPSSPCAQMCPSLPCPTSVQLSPLAFLPSELVTPPALCNRASSGRALCPRSGLDNRDQPRDELSKGKGEILGRMFTVLISGLQGITRLT